MAVQREGWMALQTVRRRPMMIVVATPTAALDGQLHTRRMAITARDGSVEHVVEREWTRARAVRCREHELRTHRLCRRRRLRVAARACIGAAGIVMTCVALARSRHGSTDVARGVAIGAFHVAVGIMTSDAGVAGGARHVAVRVVREAAGKRGDGGDHASIPAGEGNRSVRGVRLNLFDRFGWGLGFIPPAAGRRGEQDRDCDEHTGEAGSPRREPKHPGLPRPVHVPA